MGELAILLPDLLELGIQLILIHAHRVQLGLQLSQVRCECLPQPGLLHVLARYQVVVAYLQLLVL